MNTLKSSIVALVLLAGLSGTAQAQRAARGDNMRPIAGVSTNYGYVHGGYGNYAEPSYYSGYWDYGVCGAPAGSYAIGSPSVGSYGAFGTPAVGSDAVGSPAVGSYGAFGTPASGSYGAFGSYATYPYYYNYY